MREILLTILKRKQAQVKAHQESRSYGEWSCGQQDADCEADAHFDSLMSDAIEMVTDNNVYVNMSDTRTATVSIFIDHITKEFSEDCSAWAFNY